MSENEFLIKFLTSKNQPSHAYDCFCFTLLLTKQFKMFSIFYELANLKWIEKCWRMVLNETIKHNEAINKNNRNIPEELLFNNLFKVENVDSASNNDIINYYRTHKNEIYQNFSTPRGLALIINNYKFINKQNREGTQVDEFSLCNLFKQLGYKIICERDLTAQQMWITIQKFAEREEHLQCDSAIVVVLSHGVFDHLLGVDEMPVNFHSFVSSLNSKNAPKLIGKPKIFIVQACRGENFDAGVEHTIESEEGVDGPSFPPLFSIFSKYIKPNNNTPLNASSVFRNAPSPNSQNYFNESQGKKGQRVQKRLKIEKVPTFADILIASATTSYNVSWRNSATGTWFIQTLCEVFSKRAKTDDILKC
uniref:Uncharacterized protein n=1 Tax=Meloidogyne enterolobii TaxID=390850 RepID=A0A6V7UFH7_MELEN|nr:unnamed protein product [Meloidogyne enterolobii]